MSSGGNRAQFAGDASWAILNQVLSRGTPIVATMLLASSLSSEVFAAYSSFQITTATVAANMTLGTGVAASHLFARHGHLPDKGVLSALALITLALSLLAALVFFVVPQKVWNPGLPLPLLVVSLGVSIRVVETAINNAVTGVSAFRGAALSSVIAALAYLLGIRHAVANSSLELALVAVVFGESLRSVGAIASILSRTGLSGWQMDLSRIGPYFRETFVLALPLLLVTLLSASGPWLVGRLILTLENGEMEFGRFIIGLQWYALALFLPGVVARILLSRMVRAQGQASGVAGIVRQGIVMSLLAATAAFLVGIVGSFWVLPLYGTEHQLEPRFIALFLFAGIPHTTALVVGNALVAAGKQIWWLLIYVAHFVVFLVSSRLLVEHGAFGAGGALVAASLTIASGTIACARRQGWL